MIEHADCIDAMYYIDKESIDLIYLDPPFNKQQTFKGSAGQFDDKNTHYYYDLKVRLTKMHQLLKPTGSIYLHCDHTASHYLKIMLDEIFGIKNFQNEIIWKRYNSHNDAGKYGVSDDRIFYYTKSDKRTWNKIYQDYDPEYIKKTYRYSDKNGKYGTFPLHAPGESKGPTGKKWRGLLPGVGRHWQYPPEVLDQLDKDGLIHWAKVPRRKIYLKDAKGVPLSTLFLDIPPPEEDNYEIADERILYYTKSNKRTWNKTYRDYDPEYIRKTYRYTDERGRYRLAPITASTSLQGGGYEYEWHGFKKIWKFKKESLDKLESENKIHWSKNGEGTPTRKFYLKDGKGIPLSTLFLDIYPLTGTHKERVGYPTQKPLALLERIIKVSSNEGDTVLDPYCGSGTTLVAAHKLHRKYIGIDQSADAIITTKERLSELTAQTTL